MDLTPNTSKRRTMKENNTDTFDTILAVILIIAVIWFIASKM